MSLLNYTTTVPARQSRVEIAEMLNAAGAAGVHVGAREVSFRLWGEFVRLEVHVEGALSLLRGDRRVPRKLRTKAQAERVAWRNVAGFVRYQVALAQVEAVQPQKVRPLPWVPPPALTALVSVQRRAQMEWGERLE